MAGARGNVRKEIGKHFNDKGFKATGRKFNLDLRPVFRKVGRDLQATWAENIASAFPKLHPDGAPTGGSLAADVSKTSLLKVKRWGFNLRLSRIPRPARLRWFNRGTDMKRHRGSGGEKGASFSGRGATGGQQIPRGSRPVMDKKTILRLVETEAQKQFDSWQRVSSRKGRG